MKILHVGQMIGGLDVYIRNAIGYSDGEIEYVLVHGIEDHCKPVVNSLGQPVREILIPLKRRIGLDDLRSTWRVVKIIRRERPDLVHCHSAKGGIVGRIAGALTHTPTLYTPHAFSFLSTPRRLGRWLFTVVEFITKCGAYMLACSYSEQKLGRRYLRYSASHALVWQNAVPEPIKNESEMKMPIPAPPYICYIGRPSYQKNPIFMIDVIAKVVKRHPEVKFYLLGVGYYSPDLDVVKKRIYELRLYNNVQLLEWVSHSDALEFVQHSLFYMTMARYEGLPLSVIEAMSLGKAVVASNVVGNKDCVRGGENGFLVRLDKQDFANAVCALIEDPERCEAMGKAGRSIYEQCFRIDTRIGELEAIYRQVARQ